MQQGIIKVGFRTAFAFVLLLALAATFGGVLFVLQRLLGLSLESWADAVFPLPCCGNGSRHPFLLDQAF